MLKNQFSKFKYVKNLKSYLDIFYLINGNNTQ